MRVKIDRGNLLIEEEDEFESRTPKVMSSDEEDNSKKLIKLNGLEELVEQSREESMLIDNQDMVSKQVDKKIEEILRNESALSSQDVLRISSSVKQMRQYDSDIF